VAGTAASGMLTAHELPAIARLNMARTKDDDESPADRHRVDKWLWCARFFKTRSIAAQAVSGGKVHVNGDRVKPAHNVRVGDRISLILNGVLAEFDVLGLPARRGPAPEAQTSYAERPESVERRAKVREAHRLADLSRPRPDTRPDKRDRRRLAKFQRGEG
jgi:ribosome-associated heat shock protein Hsp15